MLFHYGEEKRVFCILFIAKVPTNSNNKPQHPTTARTCTVHCIRYFIYAMLCTYVYDMLAVPSKAFHFSILYKYYIETAEGTRHTTHQTRRRQVNYLVHTLLDLLERG